MGRSAIVRRVAALKAELDEDADPRETFARLQAHLDAYRAAGAPVPEEVLRFERALKTELEAQSQGR